MELSALSQLQPDALRQLLPAFLSGYLVDDEARATNLERIQALVAEWSDDDCQAVLNELGTLGQALRVYEANPHCRQLSRAWCRDAIVEAEVEHGERLRAVLDEGPLVIVCNHLAYFDATATDAVLAWCGFEDVADRLVYLAGPKVYTELFRRVAAACLNTLPVPQSTQFAHTAQLSPRELAKQALTSIAAGKDAVESGKILLYYPEGSRSRSGHMGSFLKATHRYIGLARHVVPIALYGTSDLQRVGSDKLHRAGVRLTVGEPISVDEVGSRAVLELAHDRLAELLPPAHRPQPDTPRLT